MQLNWFLMFRYFRKKITLCLPFIKLQHGIIYSAQELNGIQYAQYGKTELHDDILDPEHTIKILKLALKLIFTVRNSLKLMFQ